MKIFNLEKQAVRPRILLLDFEERDAQLLRDFGYKVYIGSSGFVNGNFYIPIDLHRVDMLIYRMSYSPVLPKPGEEIRLYSITDYVSHKYTIPGNKQEPGKVTYECPIILSYSKGSYNDIAILREKILEKGGSIIVFLGSTRIDTDDTLMRQLFALNRGTIFKRGDSNNEYDLHFDCDPILADIGTYCESLITKHRVEFLRGIEANRLSSTDGRFIKQEFRALDENQAVYAYFKHRGQNTEGSDYGNLMFLPDYGSSNINIVKDILSLLPTLSPKNLFNMNYQHEAWLDSKPYKFIDEINIISQLEKFKVKTEETLKTFEEERKVARSETDYFRAILTNGDDDKADEEERLKPPLKKVLEWLGIKVTDLDEILKEKETALMNDFILEVDGKEIICEAKGVTSGPKTEYVNQVHKHIIRYSKHTAKPVLPGMLILNYQRDKTPSQRSDFYPDVAAQKQAEDEEIGLLDTRELFNICKKIYGHTREEDLKKEVRKLIVRTGIIKAQDLVL